MALVTLLQEVLAKLCRWLRCFTELSSRRGIDCNFLVVIVSEKDNSYVDNGNNGNSDSKVDTDFEYRRNVSFYKCSLPIFCVNYPRILSWRLE